MVPTAQLSSIAESMLNIQAQYWNVAGETEELATGKQKTTVLNRTVANEVVPIIQNDIKNIDEKWKAYMATYLTPEEKVLAEKFNTAKDAFVQHIKTGIPAIQQLNAAKTMDVADAIPPLYKAADVGAEALIKLQGDVALQEYETAETRYKAMLIAGVVGMGIAFALMAWVGRLVTRSIASPLNKAGQVFAHLEQGDFDTPINAEGDDELSLLMQSLKGMQGKLKQNLTEQQTLAKQVQEQAAAFQAQLDAISKSTGMLEMDADGNVLNTNELFLR